MLNTGKLAGKTIFITGASRGIGKAIALKCAKDGANVVVAAKTTEPHPKLPGTIYTAVQEIEKAGGKGLACKVDIRDEQEVQKAVEEAVKKFGGIDVLVNNASAISLTPTLDTPMKRYDLMHSVNTRGTFLVSQKCIPYLKSSKNAHILNLSPPLSMSPIWFANHVAYTMAKYGMSMCVLGMAEEFKPFNIAVNALWPRTAIWTAAMSNVVGDEDTRKTCRKPDIMADAAYVVLTKDARNNTGNFYIDENVLKEVGVTNLDQYAEEPGQKLLPDFFLPEAEAMYLAMREKKSSSAIGQEPPEMKKKSGTSQSACSTGGAGGGGGGAVGAVFNQLKPLITPDLINSVKAVFKFQLSGNESGAWYLDLKSDKGGCGPGDPPAGNPDVVMNCDSQKLVDMFGGKLKPSVAFMTGQLKIQGNLGLAMKLEKLLGQLKSKL